MHSPALARASASIALAALIGCGTDGSSTSLVTTPPQTPVVPTISLGLSSPTLTVTVGQAASLTLTITRANFSGPVDLAIEALPSGITATPAAATLANGVTSTAISLSAARTAAPGSFTLAVRARGTGVSDAVATLPVTVAGVPKNLSLNFCPSDLPTWVATQDDQGDWVRALPDADNVVRVAMGARGGVAAVFGGELLEVVYGTVGELAAYYQSCWYDTPRGSKTVYGLASGFTSGEATISLGPARTTSTPGSSFILTSVLDGALDLVAATAPVVSYPNFDRVATKVLVRRNQNLADRGSLLLDFNGPSAATPATGRLTVGGLSGGSASVSVDFMTATGAWATTYNLSDGPPVQTYVGVPASLTAPGDLHLISVGDPNSSVYRFGAIATRETTDRNVVLGPPMGLPTISMISGTSPVRWRAEVSGQTAYSTYARAEFYEVAGNGSRDASVLVTAAYLGGSAPSTWSLSIPDLTAAGFNATWGMHATTTPEWFVGIVGGASLAQVIVPVDGMTILGSSTSTEAGVAARATRLAGRRNGKRAWRALARPDL